MVEFKDNLRDRHPPSQTFMNRLSKSTENANTPERRRCQPDVILPLDIFSVSRLSVKECKKAS